VGPAVFCYGTLIAVLFTFGIYTRQGLIDPTIDLNGFGAIARSVANGDGFSLGVGPTTRRAPLYPLLGAGLLILFGSDNPDLPDAVYYRPILIANCIILGLTCVAVWALARRLFGQRVALVSAALCPLLPQSLRYVSMTEVETLMGLWTVLLALTLHSLVTDPRPRAGAAFGAVAAAAALTKPVALLLPFVALPLALAHWTRAGMPLRRGLAGSAAAVACFAVLLAPWIARNALLTNGEFMSISSNAPGEFLRGYVNAQPKYFLLQQDFGGSGPGEKWDPEANLYEEAFLQSHGMPFYRAVRDAQGKTSFVPPAPSGATSAMLEIEKDRIESAEMKRRLLHEPGAFLRKFAVQFATFWYVVETRQKSLLVGAIALVVLTLSALGAVCARRDGVAVWPVILVVLYFNAFYAAFLAFARYSMPLFPTLSVLAGGGLALASMRLWQSIRARPAE
jgi:4-amino-4-deoxy-L-arabinose transferase-like glycosyltransferase